MMHERISACTQALLQADYANTAIPPELRLVLPSLSFPRRKVPTLERDMGKQWNAYFHCMIRIVARTEQRGGRIRNIFPRGQGCVPDHYRFDTSALVNLLGVCFSRWPKIYGCKAQAFGMEREGLFWRVPACELLGV